MNQMNHLLFINHFHYVVFHYESAVAYGHDLRCISLRGVRSKSLSVCSSLIFSLPFFAVCTYFG